MNTALHVLAAACFLVGSGFALTAAIGIVRFPDTLRRMHAATKPQVVGLLLVMVGAIVELRGNVDIWMLVLVAVFTLFTAPVIAHSVGRIANREQQALDGLMAINELENPPRDAD
ncbi:monovalent cation/H(+) antiporter subunit G [Rhodococcus sp. HNM0569]|uniref:monovalent cation/H(+) antiporter subunit G n=1 Tax=Rhodococcus sp. HNM0569 TaxID=2716340 RepID=UPI00146B3323|nr:monovalent cation/H(+) antiporter subunit G [Rhodococcus sp. HNM0569]NLU83144.1 monovalent cation/H(+) antiporter subunit G [Rhodococcus sp. HNM0569]